MTSHWESTDFSVSNVVHLGQDVWKGKEYREDGGVSLRDWSIKLLSRYAYVIGETCHQYQITCSMPCHADDYIATSPSRFSQIRSLRQMDAAFISIDREKNLALACINDDQPDSAGEAVKEKFTAWMKGRWGGAGPWKEWEREDAEW